VKESYLYNKLPEKKVQCQTCSHFCIIPSKKRGICGVRENQEGKLYSLNYGKIAACNIDPIEKKPLFHFLPGTHSLSIATVGCNFKCANCQNYDLSQAPQISYEIIGEEVPPEEIVKMAQRNKLQSISYTYTEPTIFLEYALDIMKIAKRGGLRNVWVSNGFMSDKTLKLISPYLNAVNLDLKSFSDNFYLEYCGGRLDPVLNNLIEIKKKGIWLEITTLIIPSLNDGANNLKKIASFIKEELGSETPWHITQFCGSISWKLKTIPDTSKETLESAWKIGKEAGLKYVYTGNIPELESENTFCPKCEALVINRKGYTIRRHDENGKCRECKEDLNLILK